MSTEELLRQVPIFATLSDNQIGELSHLVDLRRFGEGEAMIREGDTSADLYIIVSGEVLVTKTSPTGDPDIRITSYGPGALVGEMALLDGSPRSATVTTVKPTECLVLTRWVFNTVLRSEPQVAVAMLPILSRRIREAGNAKPPK